MAFEDDINSILLNPEATQQLVQWFQDRGVTVYPSGDGDKFTADNFRTATSLLRDNPEQKGKENPYKHMTDDEILAATNVHATESAPTPAPGPTPAPAPANAPDKKDQTLDGVLKDDTKRADFVKWFKNGHGGDDSLPDDANEQQVRDALKKAQGKDGALAGKSDDDVLQQYTQATGAPAKDAAPAKPTRAKDETPRDFDGNVEFDGKTMPHGDYIKDTQIALKAMGYDLGKFNKTGVDRVMGEVTTAAIKKFQHDHGMEETGKLDKDTRARIIKEYQANRNQKLGLDGDKKLPEDGKIDPTTADGLKADDDWQHTAAGTGVTPDSGEKHVAHQPRHKGHGIKT